MSTQPTASDRVRWWSFAALALFAAHAIEEWMSGMFNVDPVFRAAARLMPDGSRIAFIVFQLVWLSTVTVLLLVVRRDPWRRRLAIALGLVCVVEVQHIGLALLHQHYYPGTITSGAFVAFSPFYFHALRNAYRRPAPPQAPH